MGQIEFLYLFPILYYYIKHAKVPKKIGGEKIQKYCEIADLKKITKIPKCDFKNNSALLYMHTTSIFDLKVSFQRQFEGKPVSLGTEKFLPYHTFILLTYTFSTKPVPKMHKGALNKSEIVQVALWTMQLKFL